VPLWHVISHAHEPLQSIASQVSVPPHVAENRPAPGVTLWQLPVPVHVNVHVCALPHLIAPPQLPSFWQLSVQLTAFSHATLRQAPCDMQRTSQSTALPQWTSSQASVPQLKRQLAPSGQVRGVMHCPVPQLNTHVSPTQLPPAAEHVAGLHTATTALSPAAPSFAVPSSLDVPSPSAAIPSEALPSPRTASPLPVGSKLNRPHAATIATPTSIATPAKRMPRVCAWRRRLVEWPAQLRHQQVCIDCMACSVLIPLGMRLGVLLLLLVGCIDEREPFVAEPLVQIASLHCEISGARVVIDGTFDVRLQTGQAFRVDHVAFLGNAKATTYAVYGCNDWARMREGCSRTQFKQAENNPVSVHLSDNVTGTFPEAVRVEVTGVVETDDVVIEASRSLTCTR
jgi:hypothetical protein